MSRNLKAKWYAREPEAYARDTQHLSMAQHGAYNLLMDWYYLTERPLPLEPVHLHRVCRAVAEHEQADVMVVVEQFFNRQDDGWHHARIDAEIEKRRSIIDKKSNAAFISHENRRARASASAPANAKPHAHDNNIYNNNKDLNDFNDASAHAPADAPVLEGLEGWDVWPLLQANDISRAQDHAPGWDIRNLAGRYSYGVRTGKLVKPKAVGPAFAAWCLAISKGKPPKA